MRRGHGTLRLASKRGPAPPTPQSSALAGRMERSSRRARRPAPGRSEHASPPPCAPRVRRKRRHVRFAERRCAPARPPTPGFSGGRSPCAPVKGAARPERTTLRPAAAAARMLACAPNRAPGMFGAPVRAKDLVHPATSRPRAALSFSRGRGYATRVVAGGSGEPAFERARRRAQRSAPAQNSPVKRSPITDGPVVVATRAVMGASFFVSSR